MKWPRQFRILLGVLSLLLVLIFAEVVAGIGAGRRVGPDSVDASIPVPEPGPVAHSATEIDSEVATVLAHPLFRMDRRPVGGGTSAMPSGIPGTLPRLAGVILSAGTRLAVFQQSGGAKPRILREGAVIAGYRIQSIAARGVTVLGAEGTIELRPKRDPALVQAGGGQGTAAAASAGDTSGNAVEIPATTAPGFAPATGPDNQGTQAGDATPTSPFAGEPPPSAP